MAWRFQVAHEWPALGFSMIATDADETMIERAEAACYARSSLKDLPQEWLDRAFIRRSQLFCLAPEFRQGVELVLQDIRRSMPEGLQRGISDQLQERLRPGGFLVLGGHEALPADASGWVLTAPKLGIYRREA